LARQIIRIIGELKDGTYQCVCVDCVEKAEKRFVREHVGPAGTLVEVLTHHYRLYLGMLDEAADHVFDPASEDAREMFPMVPLPTPRKRRMLREEEGLAELLSRVGKPVVFYAPDIYSEDQDEEIDDADPQPFIVFHMINEY
jgi:hypothetical protein